MEIKVDEIINWFYSNYKDKLVQVHTIKGDSLDTCFRSIYRLRQSARYDNARRYEFEDPSMEKKYQEWKAKNETIEMFYGSSPVD